MGTTVWWGAYFVINFLDFVMVYVMVHSILRRHIKVKPTHVLLAIAHTLAMPPILYFLGGHLFRVIAVTCLILVTRVITKRRNLGDLIIIFGICYAILLVVQLPLGALVLLANTQLMLEFPLDFLIAQGLTAALVLLMCRKFKFDQWFNAIQRNIALKLVLIAIVFIFVIIISILNFEYDVLFFLVSTGALIVVGLPLWPILMKVYHNALGMISVHDLKNSLLALGITMQDIDDIEVLKARVKRLSKDFGMDLSQLDDSEIKHENEQEFEAIMTKRVNDFIQTKVKSREKDVKFLTEVSYYKNYESVDSGLILQWLGALLDNAIDASHTHPINIFVDVSKSFIDIRMSNEYVGDTGQDIKRILEEGYSTKGEGRGIGLHNLNQQVTEMGGKVQLEVYYEEGHNCHYLQIGILFDTD